MTIEYGVSHPLYEIGAASPNGTKIAFGGQHAFGKDAAKNRRSICEVASKKSRSVATHAYFPSNTAHAAAVAAVRPYGMTALALRPSIVSPAVQTTAPLYKLIAVQPKQAAITMPQSTPAVPRPSMLNKTVRVQSTKVASTTLFPIDMLDSAQALPLRGASLYKNAAMTSGTVCTNDTAGTSPARTLDLQLAQLDTSVIEPPVELAIASTPAPKSSDHCSTSPLQAMTTRCVSSCHGPARAIPVSIHEPQAKKDATTAQEQVTAPLALRRPTDPRQPFAELTSTISAEASNKPATPTKYIPAVQINEVVGLAAERKAATPAEAVMVLAPAFAELKCGDSIAPQTSVKSDASTCASLTDSPLLEEIRLPRIRSMEDVTALDGNNYWSETPESLDRLRKDMPSVRSATKLLKATCIKTADRCKEDFIKSCHSLKNVKKTYLTQFLVFGDVTFASFHVVVDHMAFEESLSGELLQDSLKFLVFPVNLAIPVAPKGAKAADTIGKFFGKKHATFSRSTISGIDCATLTVNVYSVFSLRMMLPPLAFKFGRIVDLHIASYRDKTSLTSYRIATTKGLVEQMKKFAD